MIGVGAILGNLVGAFLVVLSVWAILDTISGAEHTFTPFFWLTVLVTTVARIYLKFHSNLNNRNER